MERLSVLTPHATRALLAAATLLAVTASARAQDARSPYVGLEHRAIKALSDEEIRAYLAGEGLSFALAAELNNYPGPRHALDLADSLSLSTEQRAALHAVFSGMQAQASRLGAELVAGERALDSLFARGVITPAQLDSLAARIAELAGRIRATHLTAHVATQRLLTPAQVARYQALRGYGAEHQGHH